MGYNWKLRKVWDTSRMGINTTCVTVRNVYFQAPLYIYWIRMHEGGPGDLCFNKLSRGFWYKVWFENHSPKPFVWFWNACAYVLSARARKEGPFISWACVTSFPSMGGIVSNHLILERLLKLQRLAGVRDAMWSSGMKSIHLSPPEPLKQCWSQYPDPHLQFHPTSPSRKWYLTETSFTETQFES